MPELDKNGQPEVQAFNFKSNEVKAALSLRGILEGVSADSKLNESELGFLRVWLDSDVSHVTDGDILDLRFLVNDILADGIFDADEFEDITLFISDVLNYSEDQPQNIDDFTQELIGFIKGITADNVVNEKEIYALKSKLEATPELLKSWPGEDIYKRIIEILDDDIVTADESESFCEMLKGIAGQRLLETGLAHGLSTDFVVDSVDSLDFVDSEFCFTGTFICGPRVSLQLIAKDKGATVKNRVTKKTSFLVLGGIASKDWKFASYGRKIQSVLENKKNGSVTKIINEETWQKLVNADI